jgi:hypothetical protein
MLNINLVIINCIYTLERHRLCALHQCLDSILTVLLENIIGILAVLWVCNTVTLGSADASGKLFS